VWGGKEEEWEYNKRGEIVQGTLYACMESSQGNPLRLVIHYNPKLKLVKKKSMCLDQTT
jgi:hypothetical protein